MVALASGAGVRATMRRAVVMNTKTFAGALVGCFLVSPFSPELKNTSSATMLFVFSL